MVRGIRDEEARLAEQIFAPRDKQIAAFSKLLLGEFTIAQHAALRKTTFVLTMSYKNIANS